MNFDVVDDMIEAMAIRLNNLLRLLGFFGAMAVFCAVRWACTACMCFHSVLPLILFSVFVIIRFTIKAIEERHK